MKEFEELSNWIFHYNYKDEVWAAVSRKSITFVTKNPTVIKSKDIDDLITEIISKTKLRDE